MAKVKIYFEVDQGIDPIDFEYIMKRISLALEFGELDLKITDPQGNQIGECTSTHFQKFGYRIAFQGTDYDALSFEDFGKALIEISRISPKKIFSKDLNYKPCKKCQKMIAIAKNAIGVGN